MKEFRSVIAITYSNLCRWKRDYRVWLVLIFTAILIIESLKGYVAYGVAENKKITFCMLPLLFQSCEISLRSPKILLYIGFLLLLCDAPFLYENKPYVLSRSGRRKWWQGECLYILVTALFYAVFIALLSSLITIPAVTLENDWGTVLYDYITGTESRTVEQLLKEYPLQLGEPVRVVSMLYPFFCEGYTFCTMVLSFYIVGLLMYAVNLVQKNLVFGIAAGGIIVFLDPILTYFAKPANYYLQMFSPACWTSVDCINFLGNRFFISIPFVAVASGLLIAGLLLFISFVSKRVMIEIREGD